MLPRGAGDLWSAEIAAARQVGLRFHPTRGSMTLSVKDDGLPPDSVVQDDDEVLADSERLVRAHHDPGWGAMVRVALAPCSPFSVSPELMRRTAELAESLDVRLHTHLAEDPDEDSYCLERFGRLLEEFTALRSESVTLVNGLTGPDLARSGVLAEIGVVAIQDLVQEWVYHDLVHFKQIMTNLEQFVWPAMGPTQHFYS